MQNVMLDLETLGTKPGCVILSIGAVCFDQNTGLGDTFYAEIHGKSCLEAGLTVDPDTADWWEAREPEAKKLLERCGNAKTSTSLGMSLFMFRAWFLDKGQDTLVWGNGADFDLPILASAYQRCGFGGPPWLPYNGRCYRTLKNLYPGVKLDRTGVHHNALDDARSQAEHAMQILRAHVGP